MTDGLARAAAGERLSTDDALALFACPDLATLGMLAHAARLRLHPEPVVTYNIGRNINYTNVCWVRCDFCAFYRAPGHDEGYVLGRDEMFAKLDELVAVGGRQADSCELLLQGGLNPKLGLDWFEELFTAIRARFPMVHLHALSATEIIYLAHRARVPLATAIERLHAAGLASIPGAGAEILSDAVRDRIGFRKDRVAEWLEVHRVAHRLGLPTTATMMFGHAETVAQRVEHLEQVRRLQDETPGFTAFIAWNFQPDHTALGADPSRWQGRRATGFDYLRTIAVARLFLDNVPHLQASWVTQGPKIAQVSLFYGVDDLGSTMLEENVVSAAGTTHTDEVDLGTMRRLIRSAGFTPIRRDTLYRPVAETAA